MVLGGFVALMIGFMAFVHYTSVRQALINDYRQKHLLTSLQASQSSLQSILERAIETSELLAEDPTLIDWFQNDEKNDYAGRLVLQRLNYLHKSYNYATVFAVNATTLNYWQENFNLIDSISSIDPDDSWFFDALENKKKRYLNFDYNRELNRAVLFVNVLMGDVEQAVGVAGVGIDPSVLISDFERHKLTANSRVWLVDAQGVVNMSEDIIDVNQPLHNLLPDEICKQMLTGASAGLLSDKMVLEQKSEVAYMEVGTTGYKVVMIVPLEELLESLDVIRYNTIWLSLFMLIVTIAVVVMLSKSISDPLGRLTFLAGQFAEGQLNQSIDLALMQRSDEIGVLANTFELMKLQLSKVIEKVNCANQDLIKEKKELVRLNHELKEALEKAAESDRLTRSFLANISHEIRTPMNSILGFAQLLELDDVENLDRAVFASRVVKGGQQLLSILDNVINLSKIDSGIIRPHWKMVDINQFMDETQELFQATAHQAGLQLLQCNKVLHNDLSVKSDPVLLQQVINNLVTNAIKYTEEGKVEIGYSYETNLLRFWVRDTGMGIPESQKEVIFEPFRQVGDNTINRGGAGLGLAISKKIAVILQGEIGIESSSPSGSTFYFSVPVN